MEENNVRELYAEIIRTLISRGMTITTMESCTGGLIASLLTDTEGASAALRGAYVTYSNEAKKAAGVPAEILDRYGVYSKETARSMAERCRAAFGADIGIGVTGTFGNTDPANGDSVPGEVYAAVATESGTKVLLLKLPVMASRFSYKLAAASAVAGMVSESLAARTDHERDEREDNIVELEDMVLDQTVD